MDMTTIIATAITTWGGRPVPITRVDRTRRAIERRQRLHTLAGSTPDECQQLAATLIEQMDASAAPRAVTLAGLVGCVASALVMAYGLQTATSDHLDRIIGLAMAITGLVALPALALLTSMAGLRWAAIRSGIPLVDLGETWWPPASRWRRGDHRSGDCLPRRPARTPAAPTVARMTPGRLR